MKAARPILVEFAGVPASGKSTLKADIQAMLHERGRLHSREQMRSRRLVRKIKAIWFYKEAIGASVAALRSDSRPLSQRVRAFRWLLATLEVYVEAPQSDPSEVVILDEGVVQRAVLIFFDSSQARIAPHINRYIRSMPKPDLVVRLVVSHDLAVSRLKHRHLQRQKEASVVNRFDYDSNCLRRNLVRAEFVITDVLHYLETYPSVEVVALEAADLDHARSKLRQHVQTLLSK